MKRPSNVTVTIKWLDDYNVWQEVVYNEPELEAAETLIGLMTGNICESDLEP